MLRTLLRCANAELDSPGTNRITCSWQDTDGQAPKLIVQTTLRALQEASQQSSTATEISKAQVREALRLLKNFLGILEDYRVHQRGTETWHFALTLKSRETEDAITAAEQLWDAMRAQTLQPNHSEPQVEPTRLVRKGLLPGAPFQAPPLPHFFVERPDHLDALKQHLLADAAHQPGTLVVSAIYGLGGIGKSVLASALAHDPEVQIRFYDGVLWATLGQEPDVLSFLSGWIQELGDHSYRPTTPASASAHLRTLLHDKHMLLVVDDVWDPAHAEPFRVGSMTCCVLVTTREARIQSALGYDLDVMTPNEALSLLSKAIPEELCGHEVQEALDLAKAVAYLPLALELSAAQIEEGASWSELLTALQQEIAELEILDIQCFGFGSQGSTQRNLSLLASFNLSLKRLLPEQLSRFAWLGVIPDDVCLTESMVSTLWDTTPQQGRTMLRFLKSRALLLAGGRQRDQGLGYRMHDLMHDVARRLLTSEPVPNQDSQLPGLGLEFSEAHRVFLDRCRFKRQDNQWHTLPDDGYIHTHLTWHLEQAGLTDEIHQLLQETTAEGKNAWYEACRTLEQTAGFVADVARAWRLAEELFAIDAALALGLQCRYAFIKASLNTLVENYPPELIGALVAEGVWHPAQGLAHIQQSPSPGYKLDVFQKIIPYLSDSLLPEALRIIRNLEDEDCKARAIVEVARRMPELRQEALAAAHAIVDSYNRSIALGKLAIVLPDIWPEALRVIASEGSSRDKAWALRELGKYLPLNLLSEALQITHSLDDVYSKSVAMGTLASRMSNIHFEMIENLLPNVRAITENHGKAYALGSLATLMTELWEEVFETIKGIEHEMSRARILDNIASYLPHEKLQEAIGIAISIQHETRRAMALGALTTRRPDLWQEALKATQIIRDADWQINMLSQLANRWEVVWPVVIQLSRSLHHTYDRVIYSLNMAHRQPSLWPEALDDIQKVHDVYDRAKAFRVAALYGKKDGPNAIASAQAVQHYMDKARLFYSLAEVMPEAWEFAIEATNDLWFEAQKANILYEHAFEIPADLLPRAVDISKSIKDPVKRLLALSKLSVVFSKIEDEVLDMFKNMDFLGERNQYYKILIMSAFASKGFYNWQTVFNSIEELSDEVAKAEALQHLARFLPNSELSRALNIAMSVPSDYHRAIIYRTLLPRLDLTSGSYVFWCSSLHDLAFMHRCHLLELLPTLSEQIYSLGGEEAVLEVARSIQSVCQQW